MYVRMYLDTTIHFKYLECLFKYSYAELIYVEVI